jgi:galactose mutarotase-like enzyme
MTSLAKVSRVPLGDSPVLDGVRLRSPSGRVEASVAPGDGGGLSSLRLADYGELLYRANQFGPPADGQWSGRAPLLWPAVGRNYPDADSSDLAYRHEGQVYPMPIHGFARSMPWRLGTVGATRASATVTLRLANDQASALCYPWPFNLEASHEIDDLGWTYTITVRSSERLRFGIGCHLTLRMLQPERYDEAIVATNAAFSHPVSPKGLLDGPAERVNLRTGRRLAEPWLANAALSGFGHNGWIELRHPDGPVVRLSQVVTAADTLVAEPDRLFVLYGRRDLGYFCPEPWIGRPNGLAGDEGAIELPAAIPFTWQVRVDLEGF